MAELTFGDKVRALREATGMTQRDLAERMATTIRSVSRLETGMQEPTWPVVQTLCDIFSVSCQEFRGLPTESASPRGRGRPKDTQTEGELKKSHRRKGK